MCRKSPPLVSALLLSLVGSVLAQAATRCEPEHPPTHTMTIYNGDCVVRRTFVWQNGSWQPCVHVNNCGVYGGGY